MPGSSCGVQVSCCKSWVPYACAGSPQAQSSVLAFQLGYSHSESSEVSQPGKQLLRGTLSVLDKATDFNMCGSHTQKPETVLLLIPCPIMVMTTALKGVQLFQTET